MKAFEKWRKSLLTLVVGIAAVCLVGAGMLLRPVVAEEATDAGAAEPSHTCRFCVDGGGTYAKYIGAVDSAKMLTLTQELTDYFYYDPYVTPDTSADGEAPAEYTLLDGWKDGTENPRAILLHLTEDVTLEASPDLRGNVTMGVCLNGHSLNIPGDLYGALYVFDCGISHDCRKLGEEVPVVSENQLKFLQGWMNAGGMVNVPSTLSIAAADYLDFNDWWGSVLGANGVALNICLQRNSIYTGYLTAAGVSVNEVDCTLHDCPYLWAPDDENAPVADMGYLTQEMWVSMRAMIEEMSQMIGDMEVAFRFYLETDLVWGDGVTVPENIKVGICLNGFRVIGMPEEARGNVYLWDCNKTHGCTAVNATLLTLTQEMLDFVLIWGRLGGNVISLQGNMWFALGGDLTFGEEFTGLAGESAWTICANGYQLGDTSHLFTGDGKATVCNCITEDAHRCDGLEGAAAQAMGAELFDGYCDENGVFVGRGTAENPVGGVYAFYLNYDENAEEATPEAQTETGAEGSDGEAEDTTDGAGEEALKVGKMPYKVVIPAGMDVRICLNGRTLTAPKLIVNVDGKEDSLGAFEVQAGARLTICDCSEGQTGCIVCDIQDKETGKVDEGADFGTSFGQALGQALAVGLSHIVSNGGELVVNGGSLIAAVPVLNVGSVTVNDGALQGAFVGCLQGIEDGVEASSSFSLNGGEVSGLIGVWGQNGDIAINDGTVKALVGGVVSSAGNTDDEVVGAAISVNGGEVVFTTEGIEETLVAIGGTVNENTNLAENITNAAAVMSESSITMTDDIKITYTEEFLAAQQAAEDKKNAELQEKEGENYTPVDYQTADIALSGQGVVSIPYGAELNEQYTVMVEDGQTIAKQASTDGARPMEDVFVPLEGYHTLTSADGTLIAVSQDPEGLYSAKVYAATLSTDGRLYLNFYTTLDDVFINNGGRVVFAYGDAQTEMSVDSAVQVGDYYVFSLPLTAKDYQMKVTCRFIGSMQLSEEKVVDNCVWEGATTSIDDYLQYIISHASEYEDYQVQTAKGIHTYCMTAAVHFGLQDGYAYAEGMEEKLAGYTVESIDEMAAALNVSLTPTVTKDGEAEASVTLMGATLLLRDTVSLRFYFRVNEGVNVYTLRNNWGICVENEEEGIYYSEIAGLTALELAEEYEVTIDAYTMKYSVVMYAYAMLKNAPSGSDNEALARAILEYAYVAQLYSSEVAKS